MSHERLKKAVILRSPKSHWALIINNHYLYTAESLMTLQSYIMTFPENLEAVHATGCKVRIYEKWLKFGYGG